MDECAVVKGTTMKCWTFMYHLRFIRCWHVRYDESIYVYNAVISLRIPCGGNFLLINMGVDY